MSSHESHYALPMGLQRAVLRFTPLSLLGIMLRIFLLPFLLGPTNGSISVIFGIFLPGMIEVITVRKLYPKARVLSKLREIFQTIRILFRKWQLYCMKWGQDVQ